MTSPTTPLTPTLSTAGRARRRSPLAARLTRWLVGFGPHDPALRAGAERPAAPMLMSISLGGAAHLR